MSTGDFAGDGCEEVAVYTPNNKDETASASIANTQQIKIYKLGSAPTKLAEPQQIIDIARVGANREDCQGWLYSHVCGKKQYYSLPYMELTSGDIDQDGIDDLLTVANFSSTWRGAGLSDKVTWKQLLDPNICLASVLDVYMGRRQKTDSLERVVKKRVLVGRDLNGGNDWNNGAGALRNARAVVANVTGANSNEIVIAGNYTLIEEAQNAYNALTDTQKALVPDKVKDTLDAAWKVYEKASGQTKPDNPKNNLTPEEKKQMNSITANLGISEEEAVKLLEYAGKQGIEMDTILLTEEMILNTVSDKDVKGSAFNRLQAKASKVTANQVKLTWKKFKGADGYLIYQGECGKRSGYELVKKIAKANAKSYTAKKLNKGEGYRFIVRAYKKADGKLVTVSASKSVHIVTNGGKKVNAKSIKLGKANVNLKKGKTLKLKASIAKQKKPTPKCRSLSYESSNKKVATVTKAGKVKANVRFIFMHIMGCASR